MNTVVGSTNDTVPCPSHTDTETGSIRVIATPSLGIADPAVENQTLCEGQSLADVLGNIIYNLENGADDVIFNWTSIEPIGLDYELSSSGNSYEISGTPLVVDPTTVFTYEIIACFHDTPLKSWN